MKVWETVHQAANPRAVAEGEVAFAKGGIFKIEAVVENVGSGLKSLVAGAYGTEGGEKTVVEL